MSSFFFVINILVFLNIELFNYFIVSNNVQLNPNSIDFYVSWCSNRITDDIGKIKVPTHLVLGEHGYRKIAQQ